MDNGTILIKTLFWFHVFQRYMYFDSISNNLINVYLLQVWICSVPDTVNSRLQTPRYYGHLVVMDTSLLWTAAEFSENKKFLKTTPAITDLFYYGHQFLVLMVSLIWRVDCSGLIHTLKLLSPQN